MPRKAVKDVEGRSLTKVGEDGACKAGAKKDLPLATTSTKPLAYLALLSLSLKLAPSTFKKVMASFGR